MLFFLYRGYILFVVIQAIFHRNDILPKDISFIETISY